MLMNAVESYLEVRRAVGFQLRVSEHLLRSFARAAAEKGEVQVRSATAITWAGQAPSLHQRDRRLRVVVQFARHLHAENTRHEIPPDDIFVAPHQRRRPYIFTSTEISQILAEAGQLGPADSLRPHTYQTLFGLLASCGLRISEALALHCNDVTSDGLIIRATKFRKSRLVPMHESTEQKVQDYLTRRGGCAGDVEHVFISMRRKPLSYQVVIATFLAIIRKLGLRGVPGQPGPRLHDLRHTFAVRSLEACLREEVSGHILALSTYLGHAKLADTYWYLSATPQLLSGISDASRDFLAGARP
jgi:integrase/recombinase XerD